MAIVRSCQTAEWNSWPSSHQVVKGWPPTFDLIHTILVMAMIQKFQERLQYLTCYDVTNSQQEQLKTDYNFISQLPFVRGAYQGGRRHIGSSKRNLGDNL